jgi:hypothetical protein
MRDILQFQVKLETFVLDNLREGTAKKSTSSSCSFDASEVTYFRFNEDMGTTKKSNEMEYQEEFQQEESSQQMSDEQLR